MKRGSLINSISTSIQQPESKKNTSLKKGRSISFDIHEDKVPITNFISQSLQGVSDLEELTKYVTRERLTLPTNEVEIQIEKRNFRTESVYVKETSKISENKTLNKTEAKENLLFNPVEDCIKFYSMDWKVLKRNKHSPLQISVETKERRQSLELERKSSIIEEGNNPEYENLNEDLLIYNEATEKRNAELRNQERFQVFEVFPFLKEGNITAPNLRDQGIPKFNERSGMKILIEFKQLNFNLGEIEPFFGTGALYDLSKKVKLSENFYFDLNSPEVSKMLEPLKEKKEAPTIFKKIILSIPQPSQDIVLIVRIEKILQGDLETISEPYIKFPSYIKDKEKLKNEISSFCPRLGGYRQIFCWSVLPLFTEDSTLIEGENIEVKPLYKQKITDNNESNLLETLQDLKSGSLSRRKLIPGLVVISIKELDSGSSLIGKKLNSSLVCVSPVPKNAFEIIREIQEFPQSPVLYPYLSEVNNLYVSPEYVNLSGKSGHFRNIMIKIEFKDNDSPNSSGLKVIYGKTNCETFSNFGVSSVSHHNKSPFFCDEFKIKLPTHLTPQHHLLISFYHISCQNPKPNRSSTDVQTLIGYSILPLYRNKRFANKEQNLPIVIDLTPNYLTQEDSFKFLENGKPLLRCTLNLVSTLYTTDKHLNTFYDSYETLNTDLQKSLQVLSKAKLPLLINFLPITLNQLFNIMCICKDDRSLIAFQTLNKILHNICTFHHETLVFLQSYVEYVFENPMKCLNYPYEQVTRHWLTYFKESGDGEDKGIKFTWFYFLIIFKSMVCKLSDSKELNQSQRENRFESSFLISLKELIAAVTFEIQQRTRSGLNIAKELNRELAEFICNLFTILDYKTSFQIVEIVINGLSSSKHDDTLFDFKIEFLKQICDYPNFIALNFPSKEEKIGSITSIFETWSHKHFICSLVLKQILFYSSFKEKNIRLKPVLILKQILAKFDLDIRYYSNSEKQKIAKLFFPYALILIDRLEMLQNADFDEKRNFLICFLFIMKNTSSYLLIDWWKKETQTRIGIFYDILKLCVDAFEFFDEAQWTLKMASTTILDNSDAAKHALEDYYKIRSDFSHANYMVSPVMTTTGKQGISLRAIRAAKKTSDFYSTRKLSDPSKETNSATINSSSSPRRSSLTRVNYDSELEINLNYETSFILLDIIELFSQAFRHELTVDIILLDNLFKVLLSLFCRNNKTQILQHIYRTLAAFISRFSKRFFILNSDSVSEFCVELLKHCNLQNQIRFNGSTLLYLLLKKNYEESKSNFSRMKNQTAIALSKLVGQGLQNDQNLRKALNTIVRYSQSDFSLAKESNTSLSNQLHDLTQRFYTILSNSLKINQKNSDDIEMLCDLYHEIIKGYLSAPDLHITWYENLANLHVKTLNYAEAAECMIHIAALIAEYLNLFEPNLGIPQGCVEFRNISHNVMEEKSSLYSFPDDEVFFETHVFTEQGMVKAMSTAVDYFIQAEMYETANEVYKIMIPLYESNRNYEELAKCTANQSQLFSKIISSTRVPDSYYRVGFYGSKFEELDGKEFIYKEKKITRLGEITERLTKIYSSKFGKEYFQIISHSKTVDKQFLDPQIAYLQITSVLPYFESWEKPDRVTIFEQSHRIRNFIFSTPFTITGKSQASDVRDQYQRKTILGVENEFPYIKKRIQVISKVEIELSPIENSIEIVDKQTDGILSEIQTSCPNSKTLQIKLHGSVLSTVHAGPIEICKAFLTPEANSLYPPNQVERLKQALREFLKACQEGINVNKTLIGPDQIPFQKELEQAYLELKKLIEGHLIY